MPLASYLPDPDKWIRTTPASSAKAKAKQRPLVGFAHGLAGPTPPQSSSSNARFNAGRTGEPGGWGGGAGPSSSNASKNRGTGGPRGLPTPPTTSSVPRSRLLRAIEGAYDDLGGGRATGSPAPAQRARDRPSKVPSRLNFAASPRKSSISPKKRSSRDPGSSKQLKGRTPGLALGREASSSDIILEQFRRSSDGIDAGSEKDGRKDRSRRVERRGEEEEAGEDDAFITGMRPGPSRMFVPELIPRSQQHGRTGILQATRTADTRLHKVAGGLEGIDQARSDEESGEATETDDLPAARPRATSRTRSRNATSASPHKPINGPLDAILRPRARAGASPLKGSTRASPHEALVEDARTPRRLKDDARAVRNLAVTGDSNKTRTPALARAGAPPSGYTPPDHSPVLLTQPPVTVLKRYWSMNGSNVDLFGRGEEPWGRSKGYVENERRRRELQDKEKKKVQEQEEEEGKEERRAQRIIGMDELNVRRVRKRDTGGFDLFIDADPDEGPEGDSASRTGRAEVISLEGSRKTTAPVPKSAETPALPGLIAEVIPRTILSPLRHNSRKAAHHSSRHQTGKETGQSGVKRRKLNGAQPAPVSLDQQIHQHLDALPTKAVPTNIEGSRRYRITPPKLHLSSTKHAEYARISPPRAPVFTVHSSSPSDASTAMRSSDTHMGTSSEDSRSRAKRRAGGAFRPVEVDETLMTWSLGGGPLAEVDGVSNDEQSASEVGAHAGLGHVQGRVLGVPQRPGAKPIQRQTATRQDGSKERSGSGAGFDRASGGKNSQTQTQSLAPTAHSESFPSLLSHSMSLSEPPVSAPTAKLPVRSERNQDNWGRFDDLVGRPQGLDEEERADRGDDGPRTADDLSSPRVTPASGRKRPRPSIPSSSAIHGKDKVSRKRLSKPGSTPRSSAGRAGADPKQAKLQAFGIVRERAPRPSTGERFEVDFEDEEDVVFEDGFGEEGAADGVETEAQSKVRPMGGIGISSAPPLHPELRPAGIRAMKAREAAASAATAVAKSADPSELGQDSTTSRAFPCSRSLSPSPDPVLFSPVRQVEPLPDPSDEADTPTRAADSITSLGPTQHQHPQSSQGPYVYHSSSSFITSSDDDAGSGLDRGRDAEGGSSPGLVGRVSKEAREWWDRIA